MRSLAQDLTDEPRTRASRTDFEKHANTVIIGTFDYHGEINMPGRLCGDRVGRRLAIDRVRPSPDTAIKLDSIRRNCLEIMKRAIIGFNLAADLAVHGTDGGQLDERAPECFHDLVNGPPESTDHRFPGPYW